MAAEGVANSENLISVTKKLRPHWSDNMDEKQKAATLISVTKKLRPHWSIEYLELYVFDILPYFRNEKVTAPLKHSTKLWQRRRWLDYFRNEKVTAPLKRRWPTNLCTGNQYDFRNEKVTAPLKQSAAISIENPTRNFRNEKVTAPLKQNSRVCRFNRPSFISVTKKLRPHWSVT